MDTIDVQQAQLRRSREAEALLDHPLIENFFTAMSAEVDAARRATAPNQVFEREYLWQLETTLERFRAHFEAFVMNGKLLAMQAGAD